MSRRQLPQSTENQTSTPTTQKELVDPPPVSNRQNNDNDKQQYIEINATPEFLVPSLSPNVLNDIGNNLGNNSSSQGQGRGAIRNRRGLKRYFWWFRK